MADPDFKLPRKSFWRARQTSAFRFYCPLCRLERNLPLNPKVGTPRQLLQLAFTTAVLTCALWPWMGIKGVISGVPLWMAFETYYRSRVRAALICSSCGFDPYLTLVDSSRAREEVERHWRKKYSEKGIPFPEKNTEERTASRGAVLDTQSAEKLPPLNVSQ